MDGDRRFGSCDEFPNDPMEWRDSDNDGVGDNADIFPRISMISSWKQTIMPTIIIISTAIGFYAYILNKRRQRR